MICGVDGRVLGPIDGWVDGRVDGRVDASTDGRVDGWVEGRVAGLGPGLSGSFMVGPAPVSVTLRYFHEFSVKNRLEGDSAWLTVSLPLWVPEDQR